MQSGEHGDRGEHHDFGRGEHDGGWGWGNDHSHHYWWHGQYYPDCDWVLDQYINNGSEIVNGNDEEKLMIKTV